MPKFENRVALITGAASGIGKQTALLFAKEGAAVWCADINEEGLKQTVKEIKADGGIAYGSTFDATDVASANNLVSQVIAECGQINILCNIAGMVRMIRTEDETPAMWDKVMAVNASGPFYLTLAALPHLLETKGNIVNLASVAGLMGQAYTAAYVASKHALIGLTKSLALEYGRKGLRANAICPGAVNTPLIQKITLPKNIEFDLLARYNFSGGVAEPEDVAKLIAHIASDASQFINGAAITIDGGTSAG